MVDNLLLQKCKQEFDLHLPTYRKMRQYYDGNTDAKNNYLMITDRANETVGFNYVQKFVIEEATYVCGNKITYTSYSNTDSNVENDIRINTSHWSEKHNKELVKQALIYNEAYELYYTDERGYNALVCTPIDSYVLQDDFGNIELFIRFFNKKFDDTKTLYADVYDTKEINHYIVSGTSFIPISDTVANINVFSRVPVSIVHIGDISESIFSIVKSIQDAYETMMSNDCNELTDFRNSYLCFQGCTLDNDQILDMKKLGIISLPTSDSKVNWLIKDLSNSFSQIKLDTLEDKMYQLSSHINNNEKMVSNVSSLALRNRLISLEQKCSNNIQALQDALKIRLQFMFEYLYKTQGLQYDWRDICIKIVPCIPTDDLMMSQIIASLGDKLSIKTALSQLSFITEPSSEIAEIQKENKENSIGSAILNGQNTINPFNGAGG